MTGRNQNWIKATALLLPPLLLTTTLFARAGGGGGFHGGSGSGGGGGGGGGGGLILWIIFQLLKLCVQQPLIGIPLTTAIVVFIYLVQRHANRLYRANVIGRGSIMLDHSGRQMLLAKLQQADPAFNEEAFNARVTSAFLKIQSAWANQNLAAVRPFISDGVYERFNLQFEEQKSLGYRNAMENVAVNSVSIAAFIPDRIFDQLSLRFEASATDYNVALQDGTRQRGSDDSGDFVEIWTFLRRHGVHSLTTQRGGAERSVPTQRRPAPFNSAPFDSTSAQPAGLMEGNCPNCGASIEINQNANCAHCGAMLRSGQYDWVLVEITQASEWSDSVNQSDPATFAELNARDPDFNLQDLEDRASVMFWRRTAAERQGNVKPLRKIASQEFCETYSAELSKKSVEPRPYYGECAVGAVDSLGLISDQTWDRALVEIKWEGKVFVASPHGGPTARAAGSTNTRTVLELSRRTTTKSDPGKAISSAHCPNCGAPETGKDDRATGACESCGTVLNDGTRGWVLTAIYSPAQAREMLAATAPQLPDDLTAAASGVNGDNGAAGGMNGNAPAIPPATALAWMIQLAVADGQVDPQERELLAQVAAKRNIPPSQLDNLIASAQRGTMDLPTPSSSLEAKAWITALIQTALADGKIAPEELKVITNAAHRAGLGDVDLRMLLNRIRAEAYANAKSAIRQSRNPPPENAPQ